jgi:hypothetical protein
MWSRNLEHEEAKARYQAVKNTNTMGCNARKTNKQTHKSEVSEIEILCFIKRMYKRLQWEAIRQDIFSGASACTKSALKHLCYNTEWLQFVTMIDIFSSCRNVYYRRLA